MVTHREPTITVASVEAALESLKYTAGDVTAARSLYSLSLVDAFLDDPAVPSSPLMREHALRQILVSLITQRYQEAVSFAIPSAKHASESEIYTRIQQDTQTNNPEVIGWSILYSLYVVSSVVINHEVYASQGSVATKTVSRYKKSALKTLTHVLIDEEWRVRRQRQHERLLARLPFANELPLIGREQELAQIEAILERMTFPCITMSGVSGCGKSALVREVVQRLILQDRIAYVFWLSDIKTSSDIEEQIQAHLDAARLKSRFEDLVAAYSVAIILDGCERLTLTPQEWDACLSGYLGRTITFVTTSEARLTARAGLHLVLHDLDREAVGRLVSTLLQSASRDVTSAESYAASIWERVGGNPLAIRLIVSLLEEDEVDLFRVDVLNQLYNRLDTVLDASARRLWDILTLFPQGVALTALRALFDDFVIARLRQQGLVCLAPSAHYALTPSARLYRQSHPCDGLEWAWQLIRHDTAAEWGWLAAAVLIRLDTSVPSHTVQPILHRYQAEIREFPSVWRPVLERWQPALDIPLQLVYAMSLFHKGETEKAEGFVIAIIQQAGRQGDFMLQASALLAQSSLCRQMGRYADALRALDQMQRIPRLTAALHAGVIKERLQIALDEENRDQVAMLLPQIMGDSPQTQLLRLEATALLGQHSQIPELAEQIRIQSPDEEAWVLTILGRSAHDSQQFAQAAEYFQTALLHFEQRQDIRAASRAQMNLAASLIELGQGDEGRRLLNRAARTLDEIQDRVGLSVLRANLDYLSRMNRFKYS